MREIDDFLGDENREQVKQKKKKKINCEWSENIVWNIYYATKLRIF
jgi:hypothetical protein